MAGITKRQPLQRGAKTRAIVQLKGLSRPPKGLVDTTPKTLPQANIAERNAQASPLLRLLPELRNRIWTYVLCTQDDITPDAEGTDFKWNLEEIHLDIIGVCRQTYAETALLPFALGCFRFRNQARVLQLLDTTFREQRGAISRVKVPCLRHSCCFLPDYASEFPGLKSVAVWCVHDKCDEAKANGDAIVRLRGMTGNSELEVHFLDWRAPDA